MALRRSIVVSVLAGCWGGAPGGPPPPPSAARSVFDQAVAAERGHGTRRDFRAAGELYAQLCRQGEGDLRACAKLFEVSDRLTTGRDLRVLSSRMCARGDKAACLDALPGGDADLTTLRARGIDLDELPGQCAAGDVSACRFLLVASSLASMAGSRNEATPTSVDIARVSLQADEAMIFDATAAACERLLGATCDPSGKRSDHDWAACLDEYVASAAQDGRPLSADVAREIETGRACDRGLRRACAAGSVEACETVPGQRFSSCDRCAAGDQRACGFSDANDCHHPPNGGLP